MPAPKANIEYQGGMVALADVMVSIGYDRSHEDYDRVYSFLHNQVYKHQRKMESALADLPAYFANREDAERRQARSKQFERTSATASSLTEAERVAELCYERRIKNGVYGRIYNRVGYVHYNLDDAYQQVVVRVYDRIARDPTLTFNSDGHLASYLVTAVYNVLADRAKDKHVRREMSWDADTSEGGNLMGRIEAKHSVDPDAGGVDDDDDAFNRLIAETVDGHTGGPLVRMLTEGYSYEQIVAETGLNLATVKNRIFNCRKAVKKVCDRVFPQGGYYRSKNDED